MEGRESGTRGNRKAGELSRTTSKNWGLEPAGEGGSYFQNFSPNYRNILAVLPGSDPELPERLFLLVRITITSATAIGKTAPDRSAGFTTGRTIMPVASRR